MIRTDKRIRLCCCLLIANLAFIWGNSLLPGDISGAFSEWVKELIASLFPGDGPVRQSGGLLRKIAHFTEFTALGMCLAWLFGMLGRKKYWPFVCGVAAAITDETIQLFVPDRGPSIKDVALDSCGVVTGMILLCLGHSYIRRKKDHLTLEEM